MVKQEKPSNARGRETNNQRDTAPDDYPAELRGEFERLHGQVVQNIATVAAAAISGGGYFGLSVTDDSGSLRLAIRHGAFALDKRYYGLAQFETALAYCMRKLGEYTESPGATGDVARPVKTTAK